MQREEIVSTLQIMAKEGKTPAEVLRFLVLDLAMEQQLEWMKLFTEAYGVTLGEVTALSAWWHDETTELSDEDINGYLGWIFEDYAKS